MDIFVDESGSFAPSMRTDSWNLCAALVVAEQARPRVARAVRELKKVCDADQAEEVKLDRISDSALLSFLARLNDTGVVVFASAIDSGRATVADLERHQKLQVDAIRVNVPRMLHPEGKAMVADLADRIERLSPQLYAQLVIHMDLVHSFLRRGITYFAQWWPASLAAFSWRVDQKGPQPTTYETVVRHLTPALLQTRSIEDPMMMLVGANYSHLKPFEYTPEDFPQYLRQQLPSDKADGLNLGKILTGDLQFVDSTSSRGVQAVDIVASAMRRALRGKFDAHRMPAISLALGRLMLQEAHREPPIHLLTLGSASPPLEGVARKVAQTMRGACKPMLR